MGDRVAQGAAALHGLVQRRQGHVEVALVHGVAQGQARLVGQLAHLGSDEQVLGAPGEQVLDPAGEVAVENGLVGECGEGAQGGRLGVQLLGGARPGEPQLLPGHGVVVEVAEHLPGALAHGPAQVARALLLPEAVEQLLGFEQVGVAALGCGLLDLRGARVLLGARVTLLARVGYEARVGLVELPQGSGGQQQDAEGVAWVEHHDVAPGGLKRPWR